MHLPCPLHSACTLTIKMRHQFFPQSTWHHHHEEIKTGLRLKASEDAHRRELAAMERAMLRRVCAAERLCAVALEEQACLRRQLGALVAEVKELRRLVVAPCSDRNQNEEKLHQQWVEVGVSG